MAACGAQDDDSEAQDNSAQAVDNNGADNNGAGNNADDNNNGAANNNADDNSGDNNAGNNADDNSAQNSANNADAPNNSAVDPAQVPPTDASLAAWLERREYAAWPSESGPHESTGPHFGEVRTWVNDALFGSLEVGNEVHPVGAASIKELYGRDGQEALGHSVMVKVSEGAGGDSWYWLEVYQGRTYADGFGESICTGCHGGGVDFFLSPFPLQ